MFCETVLESVITIFFLSYIDCLCHSVGEEHDGVALIQMTCLLTEIEVVEYSYDDIVRHRQGLDVSVGLEDIGRVMTCVCICDVASLDVIDAIEDGDKHVLHTLLCQ